MKYLKIFLFLVVFSNLNNNLYSEIPHYLDFKFILNNSTAGKKVQDSLQKRLKNGVDLKYKRKITSRRRKENDSTKKGYFARRICQKS